MEPGVLLIIQLILRVIGIFVCSSKAKELNRNSGGWGFFGFVSPIIAMIWINCLKPITIWDTNTDTNPSK
jgi:hypothetical protein